MREAGTGARPPSGRDMARHLAASGGYRDLSEPVIVTSGAFLTPFFVNAEKLCGDQEIGAFLRAHGHDDEAIISHAVRLSREDREFSRDIDVLCELAEECLREDSRGPEGAGAGTLRPAISGGQRRDWIFSGPVAARLGLAHVSLYKQAAGPARGGGSGDRVMLRTAVSGAINGRTEAGSGEDISDPAARGLAGFRVVHIVDMITAASSCYRIDGATGRELGWVPMLRQRGAVVRDLIGAVTRLQGGEENLRRVGVRVHAVVAVDQSFLRLHSANPETSVAYLRDPVGWTRSWLREHGASVLTGYLKDDPRKLPRLARFLSVYRGFLREEGMLRELEEEARRRLPRAAARELLQPWREVR